MRPVFDLSTVYKINHPGVIDADGHVLEPPDLWETYLEDKYRGRALRIGNAAQTLHPVAGQGLNLGLRDAQSLVDALREATETGRGLDAVLARIDWQRAPDRWPMIAATDFLARSFAWRLPGLPALRGLALAGLELAAPLKTAVARRMMFGA